MMWVHRLVNLLDDPIIEVIVDEGVTDEPQGSSEKYDYAHHAAVLRQTFPDDIGIKAKSESYCPI